ncbi:penicillin-binding protein 1C [Persicimonas caeni]|uniref:penicillin-binding protein 1C n=1 Tax=Persicimonas caeni TaxID=2292766 RepID=UPI001C9ADB10|nr:penicillin-binding protein 1C [Persicimonas caeni]
MAAHLVPLPERLSVRDSMVVTWRDGSTAHVLLSGDDKQRIPVELDRVDPAYVEALIALEDERFWHHPGVDPIAIVRAAWSNVRYGEVVSGGSTITMQLVRLLEPRPRTLGSKMVEALRAMQLEVHMSKEEILEAYLRFVPYGGNREGIETASLAYFEQSAEVMSDAQIATLLAVPQNPTLHHPSEANAERLEKTRNRIAKKLFEEGALSAGKGGGGLSVEEAYAQVAAEEVPVAMTQLPRRLPHLAFWLRARSPEEGRFETTLDRYAQATVEELVDARRAVAETHGIHNTAVVVAEHQTGEIRALVGNFDFSDARHGGQIAGFDVARSTGSLLKPFLYAQGIDDGLIAPEHLESDIPVTYGTYSPENYNYEYSGLVRMDDALARSLNVPFVNLLGEVGVDRFQSTLRALGLRRFNPRPGDTGLSIAVGGVEATPVEVAELYAALANDARATELRVLAKAATPAQNGAHTVFDTVSERRKNTVSDTAKRDSGVVSSGAAWLTRQALRRRDRPDFPGRARGTGTSGAIHWKTGTSSGHKDAWTAGSSSRYTAVVWMGNLTNSPSTYLVGSQAAAPLFFDILEALDDTTRLDDPMPNEVMTEVEVCSFSGHLPSGACEHIEEVYLPTRSVPTERCPYHVEVDVDLETGRALTPRCRQGREFETRSFVQLPPDVRRWMEERLGDVSEPPPMHSDCGAAREAAPPAIASPPPGQTLVLMPGIPKERQKVLLQAHAANSQSQLSWFVNGRFLGKVDGDDTLWWTPAQGEHELVVMNTAGQASRRKLVVR